MFEILLLVHLNVLGGSACRGSDDVTDNTVQAFAGKAVERSGQSSE
jgi:hypothetical protein